MSESLTRAALIDAVNDALASDAQTDDDIERFGRMDFTTEASIAVDAVLPLIADAIEARLAGDRHGCLLHGEDCAACRALNRASGYVAALVRSLPLDAQPAARGDVMGIGRPRA